MDDLRAVLDAAGSPRAALFGTFEAGAMTALFAATYPERVAALVVYNPVVRGTWAPDYPWGQTAEEWRQALAEVAEHWERATLPPSRSAWSRRPEPVTRSSSTGSPGRPCLGRPRSRHHVLVRRQLDRHRGVELDTAGDGFFASFDGPIRAIRCAQAITASVRDLGLEVRAGLHTGECERVGEKLGGLAVNIGARVSAAAAPGEVLATSTVKDLVAGSGITFEERGEHELKGVPGTWRLYAVA